MIAFKKRTAALAWCNAVNKFSWARFSVKPVAAGWVVTRCKGETNE